MKTLLILVSTLLFSVNVQSTTLNTAPVQLDQLISIVADYVIKPVLYEYKTNDENTLKTE